MKQFITLAILFFALSVGAQTDAKIYVKGNYFFIEKDDRLFEALSKEVLVKKLTPTSTVFYFKNINNWTDEGIDLTNIKDESNTPYTAESWETFYIQNTGNFSNGGDSGVGLNWESATDGGVYAVDDIVSYNGVLYKNITGTNLDTTPDADGVNWAVVQYNSISDADGDTKIQVEESADDDTIRFDTAGTERVVIDNTGNVGIGTTTPVEALTVDGNIQITNNSFVGRNKPLGHSDLGNESFSFGSILSSEALTGMRVNSIWNGVWNEESIEFSTHLGGISADVRMSITSGGNVGIGTTTPTERLHVIGNILASGTITPDYVFEKYYEGKSSLKSDYTMQTLSEIEAFTREHKHLPGVPSAQDVEEKGGILVNRATEINLEKIEELYLHTIEQQKLIKKLEQRIESLEKN